MDFYDLDLNDYVLDALDDMRFTETTPIQEHAIPPILEGRDLMGVAQTGTGKTAAYLLPILSLLQDGGFPKDAINCVIMSPTRELAQQIDQAMQGFSYYLDGVSSVAVYGGNDGIRYEQEKRSMERGADIIIATPGRLISHISLGNIDLSRVSFFVLDEADRMLDMGFSDDILQIAKELPANRQTIMFSATMPGKIQELARTLLHDPVEVKLAVSKPAEGINQQAYICYEPQKLNLIKHIFKQIPPERAIIFTGAKMKTKDLAISLARAGYNARAMHSDLTQAERDEVMLQFRNAKLGILVATDIVARGIDIDDIQIVINYDVPHDEEDYVHRIGRTARAGRGGQAITLVCEKDQPMFKQIERFLEKEIDKLPIPAELGEGPAYTGRADRSGKGSHKGKGGRGGKGGKGKNNRQQKGSKPMPEGTAPQPQASAEGSKGTTPRAEEKSKKRRNHRHRPNHKKPGTEV
ncbi:MAG: DEAD/DEAH box helicase [Bacteroidaceae bacterium]|nr:DEAD/DEAH box helicase [Bacteroidaceae bacterium]